MVQIFMKIEDKSHCPNWYIIELQGDLETKTEGLSLSGEFVGDLHYTNKGVPVLIIGHHILYGKAVDLEKPLAVITKNPDLKDNTNETSMDKDQDPENVKNNSDIHYLVKAIVKKKLIFKTRPKPIIANVARKV